jgi:hypothetical protein
MYPNVGPASSLGKDLAPVASWHGCKSRREGLNGPNRIQSRQELFEIIAVGGPIYCNPVDHGCDAIAPLARCAIGMDAPGIRGGWGTSGAAGNCEGNAVISCVHFRPSAGGNSGCERAIDTSIIATTLLRNNIVKYTVGLFVFTLLLALSVEGRIDTTVHQPPLFVVAFLAVLCVAAFLYLIDYASRLLRPVTILSHVGRDGLRVIESVYPDLSIDLSLSRSECDRQGSGTPNRIIQHLGASGIVLAVDLTALVTEAERSNGLIEFVPQVGGFVAQEESLFNLYGGAQAIDDNSLRSAVSFGSERTMEQDPTFAFRIVIDIALKALSPAINDPTTAVLAIDQLHRMLRLVGKRNLRTDEITDATGRLRLIFRAQIGKTL